MKKLLSLLILIISLNYVYGQSSTRGALLTVDTSYKPTIKMLAVNVLDNEVVYWDLVSWSSVGGGGGGISGLTTNTITKATSSTTIGPSSITDDGLAVTSAVLLKSDSIKLINPALIAPGFSGLTGGFFIGNSITYGLSASPITNAYPYLLGGYLNIPTVDSGVSSSTVPAIPAMALRNVNYPNTSYTSTMAGFNNFRTVDITNTANYSTMYMVLNGYKAVWMNGNMKTAQNATSGTGVTRSGSWTTGYNAVVNASGKTTAAAYTSSAGAYIEYAFTDSTVCALLEIPASTASSVTFAIDGVTVLTKNLNGQSATSYGQYPFIATGLTNASHTLRITNVSGGLMIVDCFSNLIPASTAPAQFFWHVPKMNATGYSGGTFSNTAANLFNGKLDSLAAALPSGYPTYVVKTNDYLNVNTGIASDSIHPNNLGHSQLLQAAQYSLAAYNPVSDGTIVTKKNASGTVVGYYGAAEGIQRQFAFTTSNGIQQVIGNNNQMTGSYSIQGNSNDFTFGGFNNFNVDSILYVQRSTGVVNVKGIIQTRGASASVFFGNRNLDTSKGFTAYTTSNKFRIFDNYNGADRFVMDTTGRVTIGATDPLYKLDVQGDFRNTTGAYFATASGVVGIGTTSPVASAKLDITSTTQGILPPRMTTTQKNAISGPAEGLVVYDLTLHKLCVYTGSAWETITSL